MLCLYQNSIKVRNLRINGSYSMKFIKKMFVAVAFFAAITMQTDSFARQMWKKSQQPQLVVAPRVLEVDADEVVAAERQKLEQAIIDTEKIKTAATLAINDAKDKLAKNEISYVQAAEIIGQQNYKIEQVQEQLAQLTGQAIETVQDAQEQESYFSQLTSGVRSAGQGFLERVGYSSTAEEKAIAQSVIDELKNQLKMAEANYTEKMKAAVSSQDRIKLSQELNAIKQDINRAINLQQTITEEVMSANKKLFWTAVGLAGVAAGGALAYQYLGTEVPGPIIEGVITEKEILPASPAITTTMPENPPVMNPQAEIPSVQVSGNPLAPITTSTPDIQQEIPQLPVGSPDSGANVADTREKEPMHSILTFEERELMGEPRGLSMPQLTGEEVSALLTTPEEEELMRGSVGPFSEAPKLNLTGEELSGLVTTPEEKALELSDEESEAVKRGRTRIEKGIEGARALSEQYETPEQQRERIENAQKIWNRPAKARLEGRPQARRTTEQQLEFESQIRQEVSEAGQSAVQGMRNIGQAAANTDLTVDPDLSGVSLNPAKYQEGVGSAGRVVAGVLGDAAAVQQAQDQIPYDIGTGGVPYKEPEIVTEPVVVKTPEELQKIEETQAKMRAKMQEAQDRKKAQEAKQPKGLQ